jgi:predicted O-linked N-acetylglucosamine transferase (SPINDLY family)
LPQERQAISRDLAAGLRVIQPGELIAVSASEADQLRCARLWVAHEVRASAGPLCTTERYAHDRIRLAYVSADFRAHAMLQLMTGVFEQHDRTRFETIAVSLGSDDGSTSRKRAKATFDRFIDIPARPTLR